MTIDHIMTSICRCKLAHSSASRSLTADRYICLTLTAITVGFSSAAYTYTEGDTGYVLVEKSGALDSEITFRVFGEGLVNTTRTFGAGSTSPNVSNITFTIADNEVALEDPKTFSVQLEITPPSSQVGLGISEAEVTVLDDDSELCAEDNITRIVK